MHRIFRSLTLFYTWGVPIQLHTSTVYFYCLIAWTLGDSFFEFLFGMGFMFSFVLFSILFHELGHVYAGLKFGIQTHFVKLLPIGGVAGMESTGKNPKESLVISLAGPCVSLVLFTLVPCFLSLMDWIAPTLWLSSNGYRRAISLLLVFSQLNLIILGFNLLPIYPLDGGRSVRALLSMKFSETIARSVSRRLGQVGSISLVVYAISMSDWYLSFIGTIIFIVSTKLREPTYAEMAEMSEMAEVSYVQPSLHIE